MNVDKTLSSPLQRSTRAALAVVAFGLALASPDLARAQCIEDCLSQRGECRDACISERRDCVAGPREEFRICKTECRELFDRETAGEDLRGCVRECFDEHLAEEQAGCRLDQRECRRSCDPGRCRRICADDLPLPEDLLCVRDCALDLRTCAREDRAALRTCLAPCRGLDAEERETCSAPCLEAHIESKAACRSDYGECLDGCIPSTTTTTLPPQS